MMKIDNIPQTIDPTLNLEQVREECLELVKKRAYMSAGVAIIPIPFLDVLIDVGILSQLIPEVNARFGLAPEQSRYLTQKPSKFIGVNSKNVGLSSQV